MAENPGRAAADEAIVIVQMGLTTAVGLDCRQTCASVRAGISGFQELDWVDKVAQPLVGAFLPDECLPALSAADRAAVCDERGLRMLALARMALEQIQGVSGAVPLMLGRPEGEGASRDADRWLARLGHRSPVPIDMTASRIFMAGRASGMTAVVRAGQMLAAGRADFVLAGGVDTYKDLVLMGQLDRASRIKSSASLDGFIPGEGAGFLLMTTRKTAVAHGLPMLCAIASSGLGFEEGHFFSEAPYRGEGLASTFRALFNASPVHLDRPRCVLSSMNGEYYWAKEWGVAVVRCADHFDGDVRFEHPADCFGDLGAATGPAMIALAATGLQKGYLPGPALVYSAADSGERAAVVVALADPVT